MHQIFEDQWRACLIAHLKTLIKENRNLDGIKEALLTSGFRESEIVSYFIQETKDTATPMQQETVLGFVEDANACSNK